eukprot:scaffold72814_cov20-Tisochrysis_lutea.AAC.1
MKASLPTHKSESSLRVRVSQGDLCTTHLLPGRACVRSLPGPKIRASSRHSADHNRRSSSSASVGSKNLGPKSLQRHGALGVKVVQRH